ncbi:hypothetical protein RRG08_049285 [Elysia crispata]|uniref:Uncharacterized protein n=1 Tax=Elysia crispata TaxID=231223 RepID=A0AAE0ZP20_9GAST|nr:hypothetical protein RRG08_049285 [Elysia crispata]
MSVLESSRPGLVTFPVAQPWSQSLSPPSEIQRTVHPARLAHVDDALFIPISCDFVQSERVGQSWFVIHSLDAGREGKNGKKKTPRSQPWPDISVGRSATGHWSLVSLEGPTPRTGKA